MKRLRRAVLVFCCLLVAIVMACAAHAPQDWDAADAATTRLSPSAVASLPPAVRKELESRGCTIPQPFSAATPANALRGRFMSRNQTDWAVLCSRQRKSSILVFSNASALTVSELASQDDIASLQSLGNGAIGFSREIQVANPKTIAELSRRAGEPPPSPLDHDGINDAFIDKASRIWFWDGKRWIELAGSD